MKFTLYLSFILIFISVGFYMTYQGSDSITIGFMGDVMIGRLVNEIIQTKGYQYPWGNTLSLLQKMDVRIINLETTLTLQKEKNPKVFNFKAFPDRIQTLQIAQIDVANIANNHILDFKEKGLIETILTLDKASIKHVGAGMNIHEAQNPIIITKNNITLGIIGYTDNEPGWKATESKIGINYIRIGDIDTIMKQIRALRPKVDILIITSHWGPNMRQKPSPEFIQFAHAIIDAGADIIHGHSSHIFQGIEIYKNKLIMYDTGDFIDDYAIDPILRNDQSCLFAVKVNKSGLQSGKIIPVIINEMQVNLPAGKDKIEVINRMQKLSEEFNTSIDNEGNISMNSYNLQ